MILPKTVIFALLLLLLFFGCARSELWHAVRSSTFVTARELFFFFLVTCELLVEVCGIWFPDQESNLGPLNWELRPLTTGPPGKSP